MGIFKNKNDSIINGLTLEKIDNDNIKLNPGQIFIGPDLLSNPNEVNLNLSDNLKIGESKLSDGYEYLYGYNGRNIEPDPYTKLLIHSDEDSVNSIKIDSSNVSFIDSSSSKHSITANGNVQHKPNERVIGNSSIYFDGDGDYLSVPASDDWNFGSGDFTIDFWLYLLSSNNGKHILGQQYWGDGSSTIVNFRFTIDSSTGNLKFLYATSVGSYSSVYKWINSSFNPFDNNWHHIAAIRNNNIISLYSDGISIGSTTEIETLNDCSSILYIGDGNEILGSNFNGYISELRISKGIARWTEDFTPDTSPHISDEYTKLLIHSNYIDDSYVEDDSFSKHPITSVGNVKRTKDQAVINDTAIYFDGDGDYLSIPDSEDWNFGSGYFTIDFWFNLSSQIGSQEFIGCYYNDNNYWKIYMPLDSSYIRFIIKVYDRNKLLFDTNVIDFSLNTWYHIALVGDLSSFKIYINGLLENSTTSIVIPDFNGLIKIGYINTYYLNGYISELRISKGIARWTENFTPPTSPHTPDEYTKLLIHPNSLYVPSFQDSSLSNHVITPVGNVNHVIDEKKFGNSAIYFDGNGDYLTIPNSEDWNFGDGDFTIDFWTNFVKPINATFTWSTLIQNIKQISPYYGWNFFYENRNTYINDPQYQKIMFMIQSETNVKQQLISTTDIGDNNWHHVAVVCLNSIITIYINGIAENYITRTITFDRSDSDLLYIGSHAPHVGFLNGYIDELRISKGIARWTENFTPDTSPYINSTLSEDGLKLKFSAVKPSKDQYNNDIQFYRDYHNIQFIHPEKENWRNIGKVLNVNNEIISVSDNPSEVDEYTKLLIHSDNNDNGDISFVDSSPSAHVITVVGNTNHSTTEKKFGESSIYFDGDGDYLEIPDSEDWNFGSGDFTIDCWVYMKTGGTYNHFFSVGGQYQPTPGDFSFKYSISNGNFYIYQEGYIIQTSDLGAGILDSWHHVVLIRNGENLFIYIDGTKQAELVTSASWGNNTSIITIGHASDSGSEWFNGYIDELRISKGIARWTENFTPPNQHYW